ncbi:glycosyltransferase family 4 protein [Luteipulveratus halotolerans]|uniref:Glycosyltransferase subfamily 4-like N-terminal domain-containing protein n=1 Tax=Luteipulveratus halotolerans TaxID=1631356 RepID=A0A0L6CHR1_9MICO|nr:glycosyltransferase family 4 protein [Luteipulveratus halotolerans]KNX37341.1 hypothetical protein VV01_09570 [Luteipulveratus halotolerans]
MSGSRRILLVVGLVAGGAGRHVHELAVGLLSRGHRVTVACPPEVERRYDFAGAGAAVVEVGIADRPHPVADARTMRILRAAVHEHDLVHAHGLRAGAMAALTTRVVPVLVTLHNAAPPGPSRVVFQALERVVAARARAVLGVSPDLVLRMRQLGADDVRPAVVAAPALPPARRSEEAVRRELGAPGCLALVVGRLAPQKGLDLLLDALPFVDPDTALTVAVAGEGPLHDHLADRIAAESLPVRLLGHRSDVPDLLRASDLVVSSAHWEGQPVWLQEALLAGCPVVATDVGGTRAVVETAGVLVAEGDPAALGAAIGQVAGDPAYRADLARLSAARGAQLPDRDTAVEDALAVYEDVVGDTPA